MSSESARSREHRAAVARLTIVFNGRQPARPVLLLGAGASARSGVPLAADATRLIAREAYGLQLPGKNVVSGANARDHLAFLTGQPWFINGSEAFPENFHLAVKYFLTPDSYRRDFFARTLRARYGLSEGYTALGRLVQRDLCRVILTPNFDACVVEALRLLPPFVRRPVEIDLHKSHAKTFDVYSLHPQIIYLHGRLETYTARNTPDEVASLAPWLPGLLAPVLASSPVVVVGYRGSEASIMEGLFGKLRTGNGNFRGGVYWCHVRDETLHPRVRALQSAIGTNFFALPIDGFDELLVDLNAQPASQHAVATIPSDPRTSRAPADRVAATIRTRPAVAAVKPRREPGTVRGGRQPSYKHRRTRASRRKQVSGGQWNRSTVVAIGLVWVTVVTAAFYKHTQRHAFPTLLSQGSFTSDQGQNSALDLLDGSRVSLQPNSRVTLDLTAAHRHVTLDQGGALFRVSKRPAVPFEVQSGTATVRVLGTVFSVARKESERIETAVQEGKVLVLTNKSSRLVVAGQTAEAADGIVRVYSSAASKSAGPVANPPEFIAFNGTLSEAAAKFNRYNPRQIEVAPEIARLPVGGRFRATDLVGFVGALRIQYGLECSLRFDPQSGTETLYLRHHEPDLKRPGTPDNPNGSAE